MLYILRYYTNELWWWHRVSYLISLGVFYKVPHGIGGIFILDVVNYNIRNGFDNIKDCQKI